MNGDKKTIADIGKNLSEPGLDANTEVVIGCPAIYLEYARSVLPASFGVAAQNCYKVSGDPPRKDFWTHPCTS